jgi:hypothetical protein
MVRRVFPDGFGGGRIADRRTARLDVRQFRQIARQAQQQLAALDVTIEKMA